MTLHIFRIVALIPLIVLSTFYPFLPGEYDSLAAPLSAMAQAFGMLGVLVVPVAVAWLAHELQKRARRKRNLPTRARGYYFAFASMIAFVIFAVAGVFGAFMSSNVSFSVLMLALFVYITARLIPRLKMLKTTETEHFNPAPLYLLLIPVIVLMSQLTFAARATNFSRDRAIAHSAELIRDLEKYHVAYGHYPSSLLALHKDYSPSVVGIERFHYAPNGQAYNLFFEQPTFLWHFGIREIVMYNRVDQHLMVSHAAWILAGPPEDLEERQGWHSVHDVAIPHWKYFWFD